MNTQAGRRTGIGRRAGALIAAVAAVGAVTALPVQARAADAAEGSAVPPYAFDGSAQRIQGAASSLDAKALKTGQTYRDTLKKDGKVYYRVDLDTKRNAYVSVVAVPKPGGKVEYGDGFKVSIQDTTGAECGYQEVNFGSGTYTRPLAAYARRIIDPESSTCQKEGAHYVLVERESAAVSTPDDWELELRHVTEPLLKKAGPTALPETWASATPAPPAGGQQNRQGGAGFHDAVSLREGEWRADIRPGQTLFYRVPVDWGQQLFASAELGSGAEGDSVSNALTLSLDNPALGFVDMNTVSYDGEPATLALDPHRPVAHENRHTYDTATSGMGFAGWYYLSATLSPEVAKEYGDKTVPLTLRVSVRGAAKPGPGYDGDPGPFTVTADDKEAAANGASGAQAAGSDSMRVVAAAGIGSGTVLLLGLGAWTLMARRRAA
ncbi:hypothetical protein [Streptomyces sp. NBC_00572]|uniref:hypothetical protein n=1 Tax=Streptomyces sp. NBC_00572 TaxID=2903664 RepID=UPI002251B74E|nr:hypothetical protein [Streptomyces sp. NBC_00572]MCX4982090.1 hypothetical protein [Streptomyces sp. NBC_00572]